ncbi:MAG: hypothetical protein M3135_06215 [Actinomycetota bacterium]|nr:hypothetical protein [Actinomycetota bacterium]
MRAEFFRPDEPDRIVGSAEWRGGAAVVDAEDDATRAALARVFRLSRVPIDDPAMRAWGTSGAVVVEAGEMEWFRSAALVRGRAEGFGVRFVTERPGGWDPALDPQTYGWGGRKPALPREP